MREMMNLTLVYRFQKDFFVAGTFSCPTVKETKPTEADVISLKMKSASYQDKIFIKNKEAADALMQDFRMKDFFPIKTYFEYEGYEIDNQSLKEIKEFLGGAEVIWINFQESTV